MSFDRWRVCRTCDVTWRGEDVCWVCGRSGRNSGQPLINSQHGYAPMTPFAPLEETNA